MNDKNQSSHIAGEEENKDPLVNSVHSVKKELEVLKSCACQMFFLQPIPLVLCGSLHEIILGRIILCLQYLMEI